MKFEVMYTQYPWIKARDFKHMRKIGVLHKRSWNYLELQRALGGIWKRGCLKT